MTKQTFGIIDKIHEVAEVMTTGKGHPNIREIHPELCFWALNENVKKVGPCVTVNTMA